MIQFKLSPAPVSILQKITVQYYRDNNIKVRSINRQPQTLPLSQVLTLLRGRSASDRLCLPVAYAGHPYVFSLPWNNYLESCFLGCRQESEPKKNMTKLC